MAPPTIRLGGRRLAPLEAVVGESLGAPVDPDAALLEPLGLRAVGFLSALRDGSLGLAPGASPSGQLLERLVLLWLEIGDALGMVGRWDRAQLAWVRGLELTEFEQATRTHRPTFYWRFGQTCEGRRELGEAANWYEKAADIFRRDGASQDEAVARMATARCVFHASGAGQARQPALDAVLAAREASDPALIGDALELAAEVSIDLGSHEEAQATLKEAIRQHTLARNESGRVRASVALAEVLLEVSATLAAVQLLESVEGLLESHESPETRGRGLGLLGLMSLQLGELEAATEALRKAHEWLEIAGAKLRRARLLVATGRCVERKGTRQDAQKLYEQAWVLAQAAGDRLRLAPVGYALARCYLELGDPIRADAVIIPVLRLVEEAADLEGLTMCTELAVRIAVRLAQGQLALDRLMALARARGLRGDVLGEVKTLRSALHATLAVPETDVAPVEAEFIEALRRCGISGFGPAEIVETAFLLAKGDRPNGARELAMMEVERHLAEGRRSEGAKMLAQVALWAVAAGDLSGGIDAWDQAIEIGLVVGMPETTAWQANRTWAAEKGI